MLELTWIPEALRLVFFIYWGAALFAIYLAWRRPITTTAKTIAVSLVVLVFGFLPGIAIYHHLKQKPIREAKEARYKEALARFEMRCKDAGDKIYKKVLDVDGVFLKVIPQNPTPSAYIDQKWNRAALAHENGEEDYIRSFLYWEHHINKMPRDLLTNEPSDFPGYAYVDIEQDNKIFRYSLIRPGSNELKKIQIPPSNRSQHSIEFQAIDFPGDRDLWIAGAKITIKDTASNELIAEKKVFSFDPAQGNRDGGRTAWALAEICPKTTGFDNTTIRYFSDQILIPRKL